MVKNKIYESPAVFKKIDIQLEDPILTGSVVTSSSIETAGQTVGTVFEDASSGSFNHGWE